jgi:plasmid stability protein
MATLQIRDLPDDVDRALAEKARNEGRSVPKQAVHELRRLTEARAEERRRDVLAELRGRRPTATIEALPDPVDVIRLDRDA